MTAVHHDAPLAGLAELKRRFRRHFWVGTFGTASFSLLFFAGYFWVMWHPAAAPIVMPLSALDRWIPLQHWALWPYLSLWIYLGAGPGLQPDRAQMLRYTGWMSALCAVGLAIFYFWPTQVPPVQPDSSLGFKVLHQVDRAGNACPSMHVAAAIFTAIRVASVLRATASPLWLKLLNAAIFSAITWSTLATKQHVLLDVVAGATLGACFAYASLRAVVTAVSPAAAPFAVGKDGANVSAPSSR